LGQAAIDDPVKYTVTAKPSLPPSGNAHDYYSLARYYWPNSSSPVYTRRDGQTNPEIYSLPDSTYLNVVVNDVYNLAVSYFFSGDEKYAKKATERVRVFFLNDDTKMNPNLDYASWVKGYTQDAINGQVKLEATGGLTGTLIILTTDFASIYLLLDGVQLLRSSKSFADSDYNGFVEWIQLYTSWLQTSVRGGYQSQAVNNQGTTTDLMCRNMV
jgi:hypothetical protein